jgi:hypothetical protein
MKVHIDNHSNNKEIIFDFLSSEPESSTQLNIEAHLESIETSSNPVSESQF